MKPSLTKMNRRNFVMTASAMTVCTSTLSALALPVHSAPAIANNGVYSIGPMEGYSPHIGTLVSMLNYNRSTIVSMVKSMTMAELDHLHDSNANTIGALVLHLGATEKFYQINTFEGRQEFNDEEKKIWNAAMNLGDEGRKQIKGRDVKYYLDIITEVRQKTLDEFKKKDDQWLMEVDPKWSEKDAPLNTYWKWFHVCEHESNHRGQMAWLKSRLPGARPGKD